MFWRKPRELTEKLRVVDYSAGFIDGQRSSMRAIGMAEEKRPRPMDLELRALAIKHGFTSAKGAE